MGTTDRFIEAPGKPSNVLAWFRNLTPCPMEVPTEGATVLYFQELGCLSYNSDGQINATKSPVATIFLPKVRRSLLWTVGELHFLATPLGQLFPELREINSKFSRWLGTHECVYTNAGTSNVYNYYLEGSVKNGDSPVFAFDSGIEALRA